MGYQIQRTKSLEDLYKCFAGNNAVGQQVVDPKDLGAKYLQISTQIIAANNDINESKEQLRSLQERLVQISLDKTILEETSSLAEKSFYGLMLGAESLKIEEKFGAKLAWDDANG